MSKSLKIHNLDGSRKPIPYGKQDQHINSISRNLLNKLLLDIAEQFPNVKLNFNQKLESINLDKNECVFLSTKKSNNEEKNKDLEFSKLNFERYTKEANERVIDEESILNDQMPKEVQNDVEIRKQNVVIGADGAFSKVRMQINRQSKL